MWEVMCDEGRGGEGALALAHHLMKEAAIIGHQSWGTPPAPCSCPFTAHLGKRLLKLGPAHAHLDAVARLQQYNKVAGA